MRVFQRFGVLLRAPGALAAVLASVLGRLAVAMTGLALLLMVRGATGSYADAGLVSAAYAVAFAVGAPSRARSADRKGTARILRFTGVVNPLAFVALTVLTTQGAAVGWLCPVAVLVGLSVPPVGAVMRALWGELVEESELPMAFSLESVAVEVCFVLGPMLAALVSAATRPAGAVLVAAALSSVGGLWLGVTPAVRAVEPHPERSTALAGPLVDPVVRSCLLTMLWVGVGFGSVEVGVLAFTDAHHHSRAVAGVVLGIWSLGSMVGGLIYGAVHPQSPARRQLPVLVGALGVASCLPMLAPGLVALALLLFVAGTTIAPFSACNSVVLSNAAPAGTVTEAFAWNNSMIFGGSSIGTAVGGALVDGSGARAALAVAAAGGMLAICSGLYSLRVSDG